MITKAFTINCDKGPTVEKAISLMQAEGYQFKQLVMPDSRYGWLIGVRFDMPPPAPVYPDSSGMQG